MLGFGDPAVNPAREAARQNTGNKAGDCRHAANVDQVTVRSCDHPRNNADPRTKQDAAGHYGNDPYVHQRSFYRYTRPGTEQREHRKNRGDSKQFLWRMGRLMQQLAKQADADEKEQAK